MKINIISTDSWILHKIASRLNERLTNSVMNNKNIDDFDINYYINYNLFETKSKAIDIGWFTHIDEDREHLKEKFFNTAHIMDFCICHSAKYEKILIEKGYKDKVISITPGIDEIYKPKLVIGFIGRSYSNHRNQKYKTDRKGFDILERLKKIDYIDLKMTLGEVPDDKMADFYHQLDYVIISSKFEAGPMCLIEGLSCGIPVIAPANVGMASEFRKGVHLYDRENISTLFSLLDNLFEKKLELRRQVINLTWDNFAEKHIAFFNKIINKRDGVKNSDLNNCYINAF